MPDGQYVSGVSSDKSNRTELHQYASSSSHGLTGSVVPLDHSLYNTSVVTSAAAVSSPNCVYQVPISATDYTAYATTSIPAPAHSSLPASAQSSLPSLAHSSLPIAAHASLPAIAHSNATLHHAEQRYSPLNSVVPPNKHQVIYTSELDDRQNMHSFSASVNKLAGHSSAPQILQVADIKSPSTPPFSVQQDHQTPEQQLQQLQMIQQQQRYQQQQLFAISSLQHMDTSQEKLASYSKMVTSNGSFAAASGSEGGILIARSVDSRDVTDSFRESSALKEAEFYRHPSTSRARSSSVFSDADSVRGSLPCNESVPKKHFSSYEAVDRQSPSSIASESQYNLLQKVGVSFYNAKRPEESLDSSPSPNGVMKADDLRTHSASDKDNACGDLPLETTLQEGIDYSRTMSQDMSLTDDYRNRNRLKTYACSLCSFTCRKQVDLINHVGIHPDEKPFHCPQCDYKGAKYHHLRNHILTHSERSLLPCPQCDYKTYQRGALRVHMRRHSSEKRHGCPHCPYRTHFKGNLKLHLRVHTGEKPYQCTLCDFRCTQSGSLKIHMRGHSGEKPYACEMCDYRSKHKGNLVMHRRKHTGEKPYQCDKCGFKSSQRMCLTKHYKNAHREEAPPPPQNANRVRNNIIFPSALLSRTEDEDAISSNNITTENAVHSAFPPYPSGAILKQEDVTSHQQWDSSEQNSQGGNEESGRVSYDMEIKGEDGSILYRPMMRGDAIPSGAPHLAGLPDHN